MQEFKRNVLAFVFMLSVFVALFFLFGGSLDGLLYNHWPEIDDHPTNWMDTNLHP
jgi:hypothetical protein